MCGKTIRASLFLAKFAMVSIGLAGAHVQPVLENNLQLLAAKAAVSS
jgi:hypothetical protein